MLRNDEASVELLLVPVGSPADDLSSALIALHKVGRAACLELATRPIPDEYALGRAITGARSEHEPIAKAISVAVGDPNLGELIVRDAVADAAHASLDLFRRLRAKDVPAAVAVERVGMVYGVPSRELAAFSRTACELRAHPAALADGADRAVFGHVAKVAAREIETVSKALTTTERSALVETQRRGPDGRWAVDNATRTKASFGLKTKSSPVRVAEPKVKTVRRVKTVRQVATAPTAVATTGVAPAKPRLVSVRPKLKPAVMQRQRLTATLSPDRPPPARLPFDDPVMAKRSLGTQADYYPPLSEDVFVLLPADVFASFEERVISSQLLNASDGKYFRVGHLLELSEGNTALPASVEGLYTDAMINAHEATMHVSGGAEIAHHEEVAIDDPMIAGLSEYRAVEVIRRTYGDDIVKEYARSHKMHFTDEEAQEQVWGHNAGLTVSSAHDQSGRTIGYDIVYVPPGARLPIVYEFSIESGNGEQVGSDSSSTRSWDLFPDSIYKMRRTNDPETVTLRDRTGGYLRTVFVQRVELQQATEVEYEESLGQVGKALAGAELAIFEARVQRDTKGRFSESKASFAQFRPQAAPVAQTSTVARTTRKVKNVRSTRPVATRSEVLASPSAKLVLARPEAKAQAQMVAQMVAAKIVTKPEPERQDPFLSIKYDRQHKVLDRTDFAKATKNRHLRRDIFPIDDEIVEYLRRASVGETVHDDIAAMVATQMAASMSEVSMGVEVYAPRADPYSNPELEARMAEFLDSDERIVGIREDPTWSPPVGEENYHRLLKINSGEPLHLIEIADAIDYAKPMEMVRLHDGFVRYRSDLLTNTDLERGVSAVNPYMEKWLLRNV